MSRVSFFIDNANITCNCWRKKLNWKNILGFGSLFGTVQTARMYDGVKPEVANSVGHQNFVETMARIGITYVPIPIKLENGHTQANCDVFLTTELMHTQNSFDTAIVVSGDKDFAYPISLLRSVGKRVVVIAFTHVSDEIKAAADLFVNATLIPGVFYGETDQYGLCYDIKDNTGWLRYLKPENTGRITEVDTRQPDSAWASASFTMQRSLSKLGLPSSDIILGFSLNSGDYAINVGVIT